MSAVGQVERSTQNRVIALLYNELGYHCLGDWSARGQKQHRRAAAVCLARRTGPSQAQISAALYRLRSEAGKVTETVRLIDWQDVGSNDFAVAEEVTLKGAKERRPDLVLFDGGVKKLPRVHQYFGLKAAQAHVIERGGGIIWHTSGRGQQHPDGAAGEVDFCIGAECFT